MFFCCVQGRKEKELYPKRLKMMVVGDGDTGKTCLLYRYAHEEFFTSYIPTVFEVACKRVSYKNQQVELVMYDTAGQEDYDRLRPFSYTDTDVIVICFAVDNPGSLDNVLLNWLPEVRYFCGNAPALLVGNKKDLRTARDTQHKHLDPMETADESAEQKFPVNIVEYEEGLKVATKLDVIGYYETSAKTGEGVDAVFDAVIRAGMETHVKKSTGLFRLKKV